ncbi:MAG: PIG-L deacetylase family protein [Anaerolineales bacterium]
MSEVEIPNHWESPQQILVVLAHPDDPEFFCGGTIARWIEAGHLVSYCLLTCGDKGTGNRELTPEELCVIRQNEQRSAAGVLGVDSVIFLNHPDGYLVPDLGLRKEITRVIRQKKPDVLVTCDPTNLYIRDSYINHPDHRAAGQATLDAVFPAARDHLNFVELWRDEKLEPHIVREVWISLPLEANVSVDITEYFELKLRALNQHASQIGDPLQLEDRMRSRHTPDSNLDEPRYEEHFRRLVLG